MAQTSQPAASIRTDEDAIYSEVEIAASPETVFAAITDPNQLGQWWGGDKYRADKWEIDLRPGGKWRSRGTGQTGDAFEVHGEYVEVDPPRLLAYTWNASWAPEGESMVRWELEPIAAGTRLTVVHSGLREQPQAKASYSGGWPGVLTWLKGYAERKTA
jgi:uncharacterized protein YndB with AHSA1/START domain